MGAELPPSKFSAGYTYSGAAESSPAPFTPAATAFPDPIATPQGFYTPPAAQPAPIDYPETAAVSPDPIAPPPAIYAPPAALPATASPSVVGGYPATTYPPTAGPARFPAKQQYAGSGGTAITATVLKFRRGGVQRDVLRPRRRCHRWLGDDGELVVRLYEQRCRGRHCGNEHRLDSRPRPSACRRNPVAAASTGWSPFDRVRQCPDYIRTSGIHVGRLRTDQGRSQSVGLDGHTGRHIVVTQLEYLRNQRPADERDSSARRAHHDRADTDRSHPSVVRTCPVDGSGAGSVGSAHTFLTFKSAHAGSTQKHRFHPNGGQVLGRHASSSNLISATAANRWRAGGHSQARTQP